MSDNMNPIVAVNEKRISRLEEALSDLSTQVVPSLARIEQRIEGIDREVCRSVDETIKTKDKLDITASAIFIHNHRIQKLEDTHRKKIDRIKAILKWGAGVIAAVATAYVLTVMGL